MRLYFISTVFVLIQLSLISGVEQQRNLRHGDDAGGIDSETADRELRPYGYPSAIQRPGQSSRWGFNNVRPFRPYVNPNLQQQQIGVRRPIRGGKSAKSIKSSKGFRRPGLQQTQSSGTFVVGVNRDPSSLAQALGYFRVQDGSQVVYIQGERGQVINEQALTEAPTPAPEPTISPAPTTLSPTGTPTLSPTKRPTAEPTRSPTGEPTLKPSLKPTSNPTRKPTRNPTRKPTRNPTRNPTRAPTVTNASF